MNFEIYRTKPTNANTLQNLLMGHQEWRWRLCAVNGKIIASGEGYTTKENCLHAIDLVMNTSRQTPVLETTS